jgi:hypothetical protein
VRRIVYPIAAVAILAEVMCGCTASPCGQPLACPTPVDLCCTDKSSCTPGGDFCQLQGQPLVLSVSGIDLAKTPELQVSVNGTPMESETATIDIDGIAGMPHIQSISGQAFLFYFFPDLPSRGHTLNYVPGPKMTEVSLQLVNEPCLAKHLVICGE